MVNQILHIIISIPTKISNNAKCICDISVLTVLLFCVLRRAKAVALWLFQYKLVLTACNYKEKKEILIPSHVIKFDVELINSELMSEKSINSLSFSILGFIDK